MRYFTIAELCRSSHAEVHGIDNNPTEAVRLSLERLVDRVLDPVRERYGAPIRINSGYRCPAVNRLVGGAATSQHTLGEAADLNTGSRSGNIKLYQIIKENLVFDQLINEHDFSWVHVSYREGRNRKQLLEIN